MSNTNKLLPVVRDEIDFETLLAQALQVLKTNSGQYWTDMAEHDPGITLLDAQGYGVADLAYRQTRPLTDLLTPEIPAGDEGVFPSEFGPQLALTCGPISEGDYRRSLLDLRSSDTDDGYFLFLNAQLIREPESERYTYWYNSENREYSFSQPSTADGPSCITLLGNYHLYLLPSREALSTPQSTEAAQAILDTFLLNNRNLGEAVSKIIWLAPDDLHLQLIVELEDDIGTNSNIAAILADIYQVAENYISPSVQHSSTEQLQAEGMRSEDIYHGPYLQYGWITRLPPPIDGTTPATVNLSGLVSALQAVAGVKRIRHLEALTNNPASSRWQWIAGGAGGYPRLWGSDPMAVLAEGEMVKLLASGDVQLKATSEAIAAELNPPPLIYNEAKIMPFGRWRNPARYYPVTDLIPPCYNLRISAENLQQTHLHQFLLVFEQLLSDGCQQLALLPRLLAFRREDDVVWGHQWPFKDDSVSDKVHKKYRQALKGYLERCSHDREQELSIIGFLLGYFNSLLAPAVFKQPSQQFLASQQGFLSRHTELTYHRSNIRGDKVSALHRRIAARLGLGGAEIFDDNTPLDKLPFYLVEHRSLMPEAPSEQYDGPQTPVKAEVVRIDEIRYLELSSDGEWDVTGLARGQLIDIFLGFGTTNVLQIRGLMVIRADKASNCFWLDIGSSDQLSAQLDEILFADASSLAWQNSDVWLEDMNYPLAYDSNQSELGADQKRLLCAPFPVMAIKGDTLALFQPADRASRNKEDPVDTTINLVIIEVDRIRNTLVVQKEVSQEFPEEEMTSYWFWNFSTDRLATADRFSFMSSVVFNQDLLLQLTPDPYATESWVREVILAEVPSHTGALIHWKPRWEFNEFAATYKKWLNSDSALGDVSYDLMYLLALGQLPDELQGIGSMYIATEAQRDIAMSDIDGWKEEYIASELLLFVPFTELVTMTVASNGALANGEETNIVTASIKISENEPISGAEVHFWADNDAIIDDIGITDENGNVSMTLISTVPGTSIVTASYNDVRVEVTVEFVVPQALSGTLAVNGHTFLTSDGFPSIGYTNATFTVGIEGKDNSNYDWSADQPWVAIDAMGNVTFTGEASSATKTVTIWAREKTTMARYYWTFTVNHWFEIYATDLIYEDAYNYCSSINMRIPATDEITFGHNIRKAGTIWGEWGDLSSHYEAGGAISFWTSDISPVSDPGYNFYYQVWIDAGGVTDSGFELALAKITPFKDL